MKLYKQNNKKAIKSDFKNCIKDNIFMPLIVFITLSLYFIITILQESNHILHINNYILFKNDFFDLIIPTTILYLIMIILGVISSIKSFDFLWHTNKTNVYLSLPISRIELFTNRLLASITNFGIAISSSFLIAIMLNYILFKPNINLIISSIYYILSFLIAISLGFSIGSFVSVNVGKKYEALFFSSVIVITPSLLYFNILSLLDFWDNGIIYNDINSFINDYATTIGNELGIDLTNTIVPSNNYISQTNYGIIKFDFTDDILPILTALSLTIILSILTITIFKKRPAQIAGEVGASPTLTIIAASIIAINGTNFYLFNKDNYFYIIKSIITFVLIYIMVCSLIFRNKNKLKSSLKKLPISAICIACVCICTVTTSKYIANKVPDIDNIEKAYAVASGSDVLFKNIEFNNSIFGATNHDTTCGELVTQHDLELVTNIHKQVISEVDKGDGTFKVLYLMKDGKKISRIYHNVGIDATKQTYKLYDTDAYYNMLKYYLTNDYNTLCSDYSNISANDETIISSANSSCSNDIKKREYNMYDAITYSKIYLTDSTQRYSVLLNNITDEQRLQLTTHIYNDFSKLTLGQRFSNNEKPIYYIAFCTWESGYNYNGYYTNNLNDLANETIDNNNYFQIPIYPSMQNTLNYLNELNIEKPKSLDTKDIECIYVNKASKRYENELNDYNYYDAQYKYTKNDTFITLNHSNTYFTKYPLAQTVKGIKITDNEQIEKIYNASTEHYIMLDDGYIIIFKLTDGSVFTSYLSSENMKNANISTQILEGK